MSNPGDTIIREADVAGRLGAYFNVAATDSRIATLLSKVFPEVQSAAAGDPNSWQSVLPNVMAKYDSMAKELGLGVSQQQRDLDLLRNANRTDATFAAAAARLGWNGMQHYAALHGSGDSDSRSGAGSGGNGSGRGLPTSAAFASNAPLSPTAAAGFAHELGLAPGHAQFFVGASAQMRDALRDAIKSGTAIAEEKVKSMRDVSAVLGAIRSGKLSADDPKIPESVRKIIGDMKKEGIDPAKADPTTIQKYLKDHPKALDEAKKANAKSLNAVANKTDDELKKDNLKKKVDVVPPGKQPNAKVQSAKL